VRRLLLIDSDVRLAAALSAALRRTGFQVQHVRTAATLAPLEPDWDLVLIDPGADQAGVPALCRQLRSLGDVGLVVVTAAGTARDRVAALRSGADDYVVKPFSFPELHARMEAVLRRIRPPDQGTLRVGRIDVDLGRHQAYVDSEPVELTRKEFQLLAMLARQAGAVVRRERLLAEVWPDTSPGGSRTLDVHVATVRAKLRNAVPIEAVRGVGYRMLDPTGRGTGDSDTWQAVVLSPHFDDAVLSAAGLIASTGQAAVVTVLGGEPACHVEASHWDRLWGFDTAAEAAQVRAREDVHACQLLAADSVHLPYLDGPYDGAGSLDGLVELLSGLPPHTRVVVPAGIGGNPDHLRVRDAALAALAELPDRRFGLYADLPYAARLWHWGELGYDAVLDGWAGLQVLAGLSPKQLPGGETADLQVDQVRLDGELWQLKRRAVCAYSSQLGPLGSQVFGLMAHPGPLQHEVIWWIGDRHAGA
jgi:DNA-binding response OmpR family regulator/LmbE family N-acetylglucosaminyl deacetylase